MKKKAHELHELTRMKDNVLDMFYKKGLPPLEQLQRMIAEPLKSAGDFSEIYIEDLVSRSYRLSERIISDISSTYVTGAGIRVLRGNNTGYSYTEDLSRESILKCLGDASEIAGSAKTFKVHNPGKKHNLYDIAASVYDPPDAKIELLKRAEARAFSICPLVEKVEAHLLENNKITLVINSRGVVAWDIRPMLTFGVTVILKKGAAREGAYEGGGGRVSLDWFKKRTPEQIAVKAVHQALVLLDAKPAPAGEMEVILGAGDSGILLHESIGHPLEADFNYRGSSAFSGRIGEKVAADQCTIVDQGDLPNERGSLNIDDEGNASGRSVLIENGILKTYMYDLITANHFQQPSFNGRRESFREIPMPRMTNTFMMAGKYSEEEIIKSVKKGVYAKSFSGGQVDITSGDFVFSITEGYLVENGKISCPIKGATLIGNGPEILKRVRMVGNTLVISEGKWTCGKEGQSVAVGVGLPTVKLSHITVGGTQNG
ncbi:MAG: metallopeptidase TldD-related protein [Candidatus Aminicenantes bacterium]|nr:metallopeptidase TldD-related protein [Candidatus Aminicenantes bacterium]